MSSLRRLKTSTFPRVIVPNSGKVNLFVALYPDAIPARKRAVLGITLSCYLTHLTAFLVDQVPRSITMVTPEVLCPSDSD